MTVIRDILFFILIVPMLFMLGCGGPSDEALIEAASQVKADKADTLRRLEDLFAQRIEKVTINKKFISVADSIIYIEKDNEIEVIYPKKKSFSIAETTDLISVAEYKNTITYTDGNSIYINGFESDPVYSAKEKDSIKAVLAYEDDIFFYENYKLKKVSITNKKDSFIVKDNFFPPYKKLFGVTMKRHGSLIGISAGIAGSYSISLVDFSTAAVKISNIRSASSTFDFDSKKVYYLGGATANWEITQIDLNTKNRRVLHRISSINNLIINSKGYVYENNDGLYVSDYSQKPIKLPLRYRLLGICNEKILIRHKSIIMAELDDFYKSGEIIKQFFN